MTENNTSFIKLAQGLEICSFSGLEQNFPAHFHNHYLIGCILDGKRRLSLDDGEYLLARGDLVCLNPGEIHGCSQTGDLPMSWLGLHFSADCMLSITRGMDASPPVFKKNIWPDSPLVDIFTNMAAGMRKADFYPERFIEKIMPAILDWNGEAGKKRAQSAAPFKDLLDHLCANPTARFSLDEMSAIARQGKYSLVRNFKAFYGLTPWRYLEALRVNLGMQMLDEGQDIAAVSINCGFADQSHFSRCFKARTGITPGKYKKAYGAARS